MNTYGVDLMGRRRRRRHSAEFKFAVIRECMTPGVSIAAVALAHSLNANMLRKWLIDAEQVGRPTQAVVAASAEVPLLPPSFIPLAFKSPPVAGDIRIELHRSGTTVNVVWPAAAAAECAAWLSDWLRCPGRSSLARHRAVGHARLHGHVTGACREVLTPPEN